MRSINEIAARAFEQGEEPSQEFIRLMENYALWAHERVGLPRCRTAIEHGETAAPCYREIRRVSMLTDAEAMRIDAAIAQAAEQNYLGWQIFKAMYLHDRDFEDAYKQRDIRAAVRRVQRGYRRKKCLSRRDFLEGLKKIILKNFLYGFLLAVSRILTQKKRLITLLK